MKILDFEKSNNQKKSNERKHTVLIVDDDPESRLCYRIWLEEEGFNVRTAANGKEALKIVKTQTVDVAMLDYLLAEETGLEVGAKIHRVNERIIMIMMTGYPSFKTAVASIKAGFFDFLPKGTSKETILATIGISLKKCNNKQVNQRSSKPCVNTLRFIIICNHSLIRERFFNYTLRCDNLRMVGMYNTIGELEALGTLPVTDVVMVCAACCIETFASALPFFDRLYQLFPDARPVLFNEFFCESQKVELMRCGLRGFFPIDMGISEMNKALKLIKKGETWAPRKLINQTIPNGTEYIKNIVDSSHASMITPREKEVLLAMADGLKNKEIASKISISEMTVKSHIRRIYQKIGVNNRAKAIRKAYQYDFI